MVWLNIQHKRWNHGHGLLPGHIPRLCNKKQKNFGDFHYLMICTVLPYFGLNSANE
jgi:hypothetical protein